MMTPAPQRKELTSLGHDYTSKRFVGAIYLFYIFSIYAFN